MALKSKLDYRSICKPHLSGVYFFTLTSNILKKVQLFVKLKRDYVGRGNKFGP
jgi:hypothetical protein